MVINKNKRHIECLLLIYHDDRFPKAIRIMNKTVRSGVSTCEPSDSDEIAVIDTIVIIYQ